MRGSDPDWGISVSAVNVSGGSFRSMTDNVLILGRIVRAVIALETDPRCLTAVARGGPAGILRASGLVDAWRLGRCDYGAGHGPVKVDSLVGQLDADLPIGGRQC